MDAGERSRAQGEGVQQHLLDQRRRSRAVAECQAGRRPERVMRRREHPAARARTRAVAPGNAGLAEQDLQVVVQIENLHPFFPAAR